MSLIKQKSPGIYAGAFFFCNHHNLRTQCDIVTSIVVHIDAIFPA